LDDLEGNGMIERREDTVGRRTVAFYRPTQKGIAFCRDIGAIREGLSEEKE
jgi:DNA-binding PadR family transcriptional regulator